MVMATTDKEEEKHTEHTEQDIQEIQEEEEQGIQAEEEQDIRAEEEQDIHAEEEEEQDILGLTSLPTISPIKSPPRRQQDKARKKRKRDYEYYEFTPIAVRRPRRHC